MCLIDLDPCDLWEEEDRTARKAHICDCCGGMIRAGQRYTKHFSKFEGDVTFEKMCATCTRVADRFLADHGQRSNPSYMPDLLQECIGEEMLDNPLVALKWKRDLKRMRRRRERRIELEKGTR